MPPTDHPPEPAAFGCRAMALLIDLLLLAGLSATTLTVIGTILPMTTGQSLTACLLLAAAFLLLLFAFPIILAASYFTLLHSLGGQTVGKLFFAIQVRSISGAPLPLGQSFLRFVGYFLSALPFAVGFLRAGRHQQRLTWHDLLADSQVVAL